LARRGHHRRRAVQAALARIAATDSYAALRDADLVVEAVFEDRAVKAQATRRAEAAIGPRAVFATNTSTLPISGLAQVSVRPAQFIGLHFFSPVPRMPLLEIIRGKITSDETLATAMDFAQAIGKTPILVNDARGFYTTRVVMAYQAESCDMLAQGIAPDLVELAGAASGMPVPPLDEGVITDPSEADVGALLGWGFAPWTGGPLSYIDAQGLPAFVARCDELAERYGSKR
jgi:3-hydroxyacyl-CoA dehydrogenase / enoyl-CoA hydratase / 3-hydroxybutyryl-CoA epimerase